MPRLKHLRRAEHLGCCQIDLLAPGMLSNGFLAEWLDSRRRGGGRGVKSQVQARFVLPRGEEPCGTLRLMRQRLREVRQSGSGQQG